MMISCPTSLSDACRKPALWVLSGLLIAAPPMDAQSLRGSAASLDRQNAQARAHDFSYLQTPQQVRSFVESGFLVPVAPNGDFDLHQVSFPYARPEVRVFIERLASQYRAACGEKLVVTSLTRPTSSQPPNASSRSVHPTGMAVDLRRSGDVRCRQWLESTLLSLESQGILEAIYERNPPHYHVAVYPQPYARYLVERTGDQNVVARALQNGGGLETRWLTHRVARGETLSVIATRYGAAISRIRSENGLRGDRILVGQELRIPVYEETLVTRVASASASAQPPAAPTEVAFSASVAEGVADPDASKPEPSGATVTHTVARGESLWEIARQYGVPENAIRSMNGIQGNRILAGERLEIPPSTGWNGVYQHTVRGGESLWTIAVRHGTTVDEIRRRNGIDTTRIYAGQVIEVPLSF